MIHEKYKAFYLDTLKKKWKTFSRGMSQRDIEVYKEDLPIYAGFSFRFSNQMEKKPKINPQYVSNHQIFKNFEDFLLKKYATCSDKNYLAVCDYVTAKLNELSAPNLNHEQQILFEDLYSKFSSQSS